MGWRGFGFNPAFLKKIGQTVSLEKDAHAPVTVTFHGTLKPAGWEFAIAGRPRVRPAHAGQAHLSWSVERALSRAVVSAAWESVPNLPSGSG